MVLVMLLGNAVQERIFNSSSFPQWKATSNEVVIPKMADIFKKLLEVSASKEEVKTQIKNILEKNCAFKKYEIDDVS